MNKIKRNIPQKKRRIKIFNKIMTKDEINTKAEMGRNAISNIMITINGENSKIEKNSKINIIQKENNDLNKENNKNNNTSNILIKKINYNDYEFNNLSYQEALKLDKRTYFQ